MPKKQTKPPYKKKPRKRRLFPCSRCDENIPHYPTKTRPRYPKKPKPNPNDSKMDFTLPGYNYLGPGTNLDTAGLPTNKLDAAARTHDLRYDTIGKQRGRGEITEREAESRVARADAQLKREADAIYADSEEPYGERLMAAATGSAMTIKQAVFPAGAFADTKHVLYPSNTCKPRPRAASDIPHLQRDRRTRKVGQGYSTLDDLKAYVPEKKDALIGNSVPATSIKQEMVNTEIALIEEYPMNVDQNNPSGPPLAHTHGPRWEPPKKGMSKLHNRINVRKT